MNAEPVHKDEIVITRAHVDELAELSAIAHRAKAHWGYPREWIDEWSVQLTLTLDVLTSCEVQVARVADWPLGFYALDTAAEPAVLDHLWVDPAYMGHGVGRLLLGHAQEQTRQQGHAQLQIDSDPNAEPFYLRLGAKRIALIDAPVSGDADRKLPRLLLHVPSSLESGNGE